MKTEELRANVKSDLEVVTTTYERNGWTRRGEPTLEEPDEFDRIFWLQIMVKSDDEPATLN